MTAKRYFLFLMCFSTIIMLGLFSCQQRTKENVEQREIVKDSVNIDTAKAVTVKGSDQYPEIYAFIKQLIKQKELNDTYGLIIEPAAACDLSQNDNTFLKTLLLEKKKIQAPYKEPADTLKSITDSSSKLNINTKISYNAPQPITLLLQPEKCLTKKDIRYMVAQKPDPVTFRWDNSALGFNMKNDSNYYSISIPLFSLDHKKAVVLIEQLCPGLCGTGNSYVYFKKKDKWVTTSFSFGWIH
jgi:hypothetical protein